MPKKQDDEPKANKEIVIDAEPAEKVDPPANGPLADDVDAIGKNVAVYPIEQPDPSTVNWDTSKSDQPEITPDPPFHGNYTLLVNVDFVDADGKDVHLDAGVIDATKLPLDFAEHLLESGQLVKGIA